MAERSTKSVDVSKLATATALLAAVGAAAFLAWRRTAPLARHAKNRRGGSGQRAPDAQRNPRTAPF